MGKHDTKYKLKYSRFYFRNRWAEPDYMREDNWTFVGIGMRWSGPNRICYKISFFGFDFSYWFDRIKCEN